MHARVRECVRAYVCIGVRVECGCVRLFACTCTRIITAVHCEPGQQTSRFCVCERLFLWPTLCGVTNDAMIPPNDRINAHEHVNDTWI